MDIKYIQNPEDDEKITKNDFVLVSKEFSTESSRLDWYSTPAKTAENNEKYMKKLIDRDLQLLSKAGGGLLLLDNILAASTNTKNIVLSLTDERHFQGGDLGNIYVGFTGNLGVVGLQNPRLENLSVDIPSLGNLGVVATDISRLDVDFRARCKNFFTQDEVNSALGYASTLSDKTAITEEFFDSSGVPC